VNENESIPVVTKNIDCQRVIQLTQLRHQHFILSCIYF